MMGVIILILTLVAKLLFDSYLHFSKKTIKHKGEAAIVVVLLAIGACLQAHGILKISAGVFLLCYLFIFWAVFDTLFGLIIARDPFYLGTTSALDRLQKKYTVLLILKYLLAVLSIALLITGKINHL